MSEPEWLEVDEVFVLHLRQLERHGGATGVRDAGLLDSALARPKFLFKFEGADIARMAAAYCFGIVQNHPFVDGNKRTGFMAMYTFLGYNAFDFDEDEAEVVVKVRGLAAGVISEADFATWVKNSAVPDAIL